MITAGIDIGIENTKIVIVNDGAIVTKGMVSSGGEDRTQNAEKLFAEKLSDANLSDKDISYVVSTGIGKFNAPFANKSITEAVADVSAVRMLFPDANAVVDFGANQVLVMSIDGNTISEAAPNQKCSAGIGLFLKRAGKRLALSFEEMSNLDLIEDSGVTVNDFCRVYAELDMLSLLNQGVSRKAIAVAAMKAMAARFSSVLNDKVKPPKDGTVLIGGVAKSKAMVEACRAQTGINFIIPDDPEYMCAYGAALMAAKAAQNDGRTESCFGS